MKYETDEERELFLMFFWLLTLVPQICLMIVLSIKYNYFYWQLLLSSILWFFVMGYVYYFFHTTIRFDKDKIIIKNRRKIREIYFSDIQYIEEKIRMKDTYTLHRLELVFQSEGNKKSVIIRNKRIQRDLNDLFIGAKIVKKEILD